jgi:S-(hydroxymethyl)glutathione dehydrogenase/alcohol dehydrogenase
MLMKAAVCREAGKSMAVEEVELDEPAAGEVRVKISAVSICHTDVFAASRLTTLLPIVLGHEGAGVVDKVGAGAAGLNPGDHVVLTGAAACGRCGTCIRGNPAMCEVFRPEYFTGYLPGKVKRLKGRDGRPISHFFLQSSFAQYSVVPQECAIKVRTDAPLDNICMLGCGVITGMGAAINRGQVRVGEDVAVFGCGGVGISAVMGARLAGAGRIIAVDVIERKLTWAREFGATHTINATNEDPVEAIKKLTGRGVDCAVAATEAAPAIPQGIDALAHGGRCVFVASPDGGGKVNTRVLLLHRSLLGCSMGSGQASRDIPAYVELFMQGRLPLDKMVTRRFKLEQINEAFQTLEKGEVLKAVIMMD